MTASSSRDLERKTSRSTTGRSIERSVAEREMSGWKSYISGKAAI
jgi:hypothetical protein